MKKLITCLIVLLFFGGGYSVGASSVQQHLSDVQKIVNEEHDLVVITP